MTEQESNFHKAMIEMCRRREEELGYRPSVILSKMSETGAVATAQWAINISGDSSGLTKLWEAKPNRLDISIQAIILKEQFTSLFSVEDRRLAFDTLKDHGYVFPNGQKRP